MPSSILSLDSNSERFIDPEINMDCSELVTSKGIPHERHNVTTEDGFVLGMDRLPRPFSKKRYPVLLVHGVLMSSDTWLVNHRNQSLPFYLWDQGFDVWLGNVRGNKHSRRHKNLDPDQGQFWRWTFDEMGRYDVTSMVEYVTKVTKKRKVNYIGHSQGCVVLFSSVIQNSDVGRKINKFFALAPAGYIASMTSPIKYLSPLIETMYMTKSLFSSGSEFLPSFNASSSWISRFCSNYPVLCANPLYTFAGKSRYGNLNETRLPVYVAHDPSGTSLQNAMHWIQMQNAPKDRVEMSFHDHGNMWNIYEYGSIWPPTYNFSLFTGIPTYFFCGTKDKMVTYRDCRMLSEVLPSIRKLHKINGYAHADFLYAVNAVKKIYRRIARQMR